MRDMGNKKYTLTITTTAMNTIFMSLFISTRPKNISKTS
jgi:hypothetical protein